jgi:hypothetical protein
MSKYKKGLHPFNEEKHQRFATAASLGYSFPSPTYPIDKTAGLTELGMDGNGPDTTVTLVSEDASINLQDGSGNCAVCEAPAHIDLVSAALAGLPTIPNRLTSDQTLTVYYLYQAAQAGVEWKPGTPIPAGLDVGCDLGDLLLWLFRNNAELKAQGLAGVEGFVALDLSEVDAALSEFNTVIAGWILPTDIDAFEVAFDNGAEATISASDPPNPNEGHCMGICFVKNVGDVNKLRTWGGLILVSPEFREGCLQQAFLVLTEQEAEAKNFPFSAAVAALTALGGTE